MMEYVSARETLKAKLREQFDGKIVRKDLTKKIKEGANVPVYVLEFLLGQYCSSDDDAIIESGVQQVKRILADNFVRPDESQKILSQLRKRGSHTVIDMITVQLDIQKNRYFAEFSNLGLQKVPIEDEYPEKFDRLLCGFQARLHRAHLVRVGDHACDAGALAVLDGLHLFHLTAGGRFLYCCRRSSLRSICCGSTACQHGKSHRHT